VPLSTFILFELLLLFIVSGFDQIALLLGQIIEKSFDLTTDKKKTIGQGVLFLQLISDTTDEFSKVIEETDADEKLKDVQMK
jgi:hypothetical protein